MDRRILAIVEVVLCSSIPTQLLITVLLRTAGWSPLDQGGQLSFPFVVALSLGDAVVLVALMAAITRLHGESVSTLWLGRRPVRREVMVGILLIPLVFVLVVAVLNLLRVYAPWLHNVPLNPLEDLAKSPGEAALFAIVAIFAGGVREELQRAFLLRRFEHHLGGMTAGIVLLSVGFGLGHVVQGWDAVITTGLLGAFWAIVYARRRSTVAPVISHSGFNSLEILRVAIGGP
jgi:membrane protease YdiL (CAAX protease family)